MVLPAILLVLAFLLIGFAQTARAGALLYTVNVVTSPVAGGSILINQRGRTLYVNTRDTNGVSNCDDNCMAYNPNLVYSPLRPSLAGSSVAGSSGAAAAFGGARSGGMPTLDPMAPGTLSVITRIDGTQQVAYNGAPLYLYAGDAAPGVANGQCGFGCADFGWTVAVPATANP
jgi:predicted lipoprotein with Yx(FWY)xxD motif